MAWRLLLQRTRPFGCIEREGKQVVILGVPLDSTATHRPGTRFAPNAIREAACSLELYSYATEADMEDLGITDLGDVAIPQGDVHVALENIKAVARGVYEEYPGSLKVFLGGEHLITLPIVRAAGRSVDRVVVFDAHLDLRDEYLGSRFNHATFARRLADEGYSLIYIGSRAFSREELRFLAGAKDVEVIPARRMREGGARLGNLGRVYVSIDIDVLDPAYAPGTGAPEPLGMAPLELLDALKGVIESSEKIVGMDVVEVNPLVDPSGATSFLAAKLVLEAVAMALRKTRLL